MIKAVFRGVSRSLDMVAESDIFLPASPASAAIRLLLGR
jgi:hypothetical protein